MEPELDDKGGTIHESSKNNQGEEGEQEAAAAAIDRDETVPNLSRDADIAVESSIIIPKLTNEGTLEQGNEEVKLIISDAEVQDAEGTMLAEPIESTIGTTDIDSVDPSAISTAPTSITTSTLSIPALQKKFTSLSVNKQFLEKASPTSTTSVIPIINKVTTSQPLGRLVSSSPASRLTSAKLSTSVAKPASVGWGQITSPGLASPGADPLSSVIAGSSVKGGTTGASPKLVTALTSGSAARSTSPHQKGSPGLRNASLGASGRSGLINSGTSTTNTSKAPWASVKTENAKVKSNLVNDFPTAAEAARAKLEAEKREKAAAAEAAARAEQTLQTLERFRGASIGGNHWDEMDDEDDLDEVVQFGDGTQYKVPVTKEEEPVSKEERFKDVGHDRSWPLSSSAAQQQATAGGTTSIQQSAPVPRPVIATRNSSTRDPPLLSPSSQEPHAPTKLFNSRHATKIEIKAGEGVSLDTDVDRGYNNNQRGSAFYRRDRDNLGSHPSSSHAHIHAQNSGSSSSATATAPVRAWGPLAQRQASLNPDAPKPAIISPPASQKAASIASPTLSAAATSQPLLRNTSQQSNDYSTARSTSSGQGIGSNNERVLPPHLVNQAAAAATSNKTLPSTANDTDSDLGPVQATPYGARFASSANTATSPSLERAPPSILRAEKPPVVTAENQREEMLSAAERARKRREEEENLRLAEKERAKAKAAAIEEKMNIAKEEEMKKKREEEEARLQKRVELEKRRRKEQEASANNAQRRDTEIRPALMSPSDEAITWRRGIPAVAAAPGSSSNNAVNASGTSFQDIRPVPLESNSSQPVTLLQRPAPKSSTEMLSPTNGRANIADVSKTRNGNALVDQKPRSEAKIPTGPKGNSSQKLTTSEIMSSQTKAAPRAPRVDIIAPTDARAALHHEEQEKQREARQMQKSPGKQPIGVLKSPAAASNSTVTIPPEDAATKKEIEFEGVPVWNRYKVKVGSSRPVPKLPFYVVKAQKIRVAESKRPESEPRSVEVLSWDPPMPFLSSRTLSRDDLFHPKKYRKGIVIANVAMPMDLLERGKKRPKLSQQQEEVKNAVPLIVKVPSFKAVQDTVRQNAVSAAANSFERRPVPGGVNADIVQVTSRNSLDPVIYSTSIAARVNTPSPVSFLTSSEVKPVSNSQVVLPIASIPVATSATASTPAVLPKSTSNPTWGQTTLFNLETEDTSRGVEEGDHIRQVWSHASNDNVNMQNSLKDIVDEFPDVAAQYHDVGINTTSEAANNHHNSAPASRLYSPLVASHEVNPEMQRNEKSNGFNTSASSPSFAAKGGLQQMGDVMMAEAEGDFGSRVTRGQSYSHSQSHYSQDQRRPYTNNAFSAYAYPSPIDELSQSGYYSNQGQYRNQQQHYNQHHYQQQQQQPRYSGAYDNGMDHMSTGAQGGYGSSYRSSSNPPSSHHHNQSMLNSSNYGQQTFQQHQSSYYNGQQGGGSHRSAYNSTSNSPGSMRNNLYPGAARGSSIRGYRSNDTSSTVW